MPSPPIRWKRAAKAWAWRRAPAPLIADPEFVQFHPTAIAIGRDPAPLATEALRGEGAVLVNDRGERFMTAVHDDAELAPRDVVARAIHRQIVARPSSVPGLPRGHRRGIRRAISPPSMPPACRPASIRRAQPIPVAPAAHYHMGGIASDAQGRSSLPGLWVVGECAATGLHGANRLASNSLLEGLVFGARVADDVRGQLAAGRAARPAARAAALCLAGPAACAAQRHEPRCRRWSATPKACARRWT